MALKEIISGLYTDFYQLTMAQGYFSQGIHEKPAAFDYFFRKLPFEGNYAVFTGIDLVVDALENFRFEKEDIQYLKEYGFDKKFLDYLSKFSFKGTISSVKQGEIVFASLPTVRVKGTILECQLIETMLLNLLNYSTLISTKANRMRVATGNGKSLFDFGLRRAHGQGGIIASKAAIEGGFNGTSNVYAAKKYGLTATGTMAHSWIQAFDSELEAFRKYVESCPTNPVLLVDTYDTLNSGIPNAIKLAKELESKDQKLFGIRLDSGDIQKLSNKARKMLDDAGLDYVKIAASDKIDEYAIQKLVDKNAPVGAFGIGTRLVTGQPDAALDGVFKLSMLDHQPRIKISDNIEKTTLPGLKKSVRYYDRSSGQASGDAVVGDEEEIPRYIHDLFDNYSTRDYKKYKGRELHDTVMENGKKTIRFLKPDEVSSYTQEQLQTFPEEVRKIVKTRRPYFTGISVRLKDLRSGMISKSEY